MQFRFMASVGIFFGSYLPLSLILLAQDYDYKFVGYNVCWKVWDTASNCKIPLRNPGYSLTIFFICLVCFSITLLALSKAQPKLPIDIREAKYIPAELMSYTLPYVVSFMSLNYHETGKFVGLFIFLGWMFWIAHKSGQLILNPILIVFGWRLYEITYVFPGDAQQRHGRALAKLFIEPGKRYSHVNVQDIVVLGEIKSESTEIL